MVIQTLGEKYTVIKYIFSDSNMERYLCEEENGQRDTVVCIKNKSWIAEIMEYSMGQRENRHFTDFLSCFISGENFYIVMKYYEGISLKEKLENETCSLEERLAVGKSILDQMMLLNMPDCFLCDCLKPESIILSADLKAHFRYSLERLTEYGQYSFGQVQSQLGNLYKELFAGELNKKMLPPLARFCRGLRGGRYEDILAVYGDYDEMAEKVEAMVSEKTMQPGTWGFRFWERARRYLVYLRKLCALVLILCAVAFLVYAIWTSQQDGRTRKSLEYIGTLKIRENREGMVFFMKFTGNYHVYRTFRTSVEKVSRILLAPLQMCCQKIRHAADPASIVGKVSGDIREEVKQVGSMPDSLDGYYQVGRRYVAKKMIYLVALLLVVSTALLILFGLPWLRARFFTETFVINSEKMQGYTGKVRLINNRTDRTLLYAGDMKEGRITGQGTLYNYRGKKIYQGSFLMEEYEGEGETYYSSGRLRYRGDFAGSQYEGKGTSYYPNGEVEYSGEYERGKFSGKGELHYRDGSLRYEGGFAGNQFSGEGSLYDARGKVIASGTFEKDELREGKAVLYDEKGQVEYRGEISEGRYQGTGTLYRAGKLRYQGNFRDGKYEGIGTLYAGNGKKTYQGEFAAGAYEGEGTLYDRGKKVYQGGFAAGRYEGKGTLYAGKVKVYQGEFASGVYEGKGTLYAGKEKIYEGEFAAGVYEGQGILYAGEQEIYAGEFSRGMRSGAGKEFGKEGVLVYDGDFAQDQYEGSGKLFDEKTGELQYDGGFYQGKYEGDGKLYDSKKGLLRYEGQFHQGECEGEGKLYGREGLLRYEGGFLKGKFSGNGILYDTGTGRVKKEGSFVDGKLVYEKEESNSEGGGSWAME